MVNRQIAIDHGEGTVALLAINAMREIGPVCLESILQNSDSRICIGYIKSEDIDFLPKDDRITYMDLSNQARTLGLDLSSTTYVDYTKSEFFKLVQLKWDLLLGCLKLENCRWVIYSDFDVIWLRDATKPIVDSFNKMGEIEIMIQNNSFDPSNRSLCMGFVGIRQSSKLIASLEDLKTRHRLALEKDPYIGDDGVISDFLLGGSSGINFLELPQGGFPTGNYANLLSRHNVFPGLSAPKPFIFHANYVIGERKKTLLLYLISKSTNDSTSLFGRWRVLSYRLEYIARKMNVTRRRMLNW
jgi:hypothetical protein